MQGTFFTKFSS